MPRYFFHVMDGHATIDQEGTEIGGIDEVYRQAITAAGEILANGEAFSMLEGPWNMTVADEDGKTVMALRFNVDLYL
jgi:hypothetical protein